MSLTQEQEDFVRRQHRDGTPMKSVNDIPQPTGFSPLVPNAEIEAWRNEPKMKPVDLNEDYSVEKKINDCGFPGKPGQFYATVGLNRQQVLSMSAKEIRAAIEAYNHRDDAPVPHTNFAIDPAAKPRTRGAAILL